MGLDCFRLLADLNRAGMSNAQVGRKLGKGRSTVQKWKLGAEPGYTDGCRLVALHASVTANARQSVRTMVHSSP